MKNGAFFVFTTTSESLSLSEIIVFESWRFLKSVYYNENMNPNSNFKGNFLKNYNDSEVVVKTKNAPFVMIFPNILFLYRVFVQVDWSFNIRSY